VVGLFEGENEGLCEGIMDGDDVLGIEDGIKLGICDGGADGSKEDVAEG
jgi:hypothetical protein